MSTIHEQAHAAAEWHSSQAIRRANRSWVAKFERAYWENLDWALRFYDIAVALESRQATEGGVK